MDAIQNWEQLSERYDAYLSKTYPLEKAVERGDPRGPFKNTLKTFYNALNPGRLSPEGAETLCKVFDRTFNIFLCEMSKGLARIAQE